MDSYKELAELFNLIIDDSKTILEQMEIIKNHHIKGDLGNHYKILYQELQRNSVGEESFLLDLIANESYENIDVLLSMLMEEDFTSDEPTEDLSFELDYINLSESTGNQIFEKNPLLRICQYLSLIDQNISLNNNGVNIEKVEDYLLEHVHLDGLRYILHKEKTKLNNLSQNITKDFREYQKQKIQYYELETAILFSYKVLSDEHYLNRYNGSYYEKFSNYVKEQFNFDTRELIFKAMYLLYSTTVEDLNRSTFDDENKDVLSMYYTGMIEFSLSLFSKEEKKAIQESQLQKTKILERSFDY